MGEAGHCVLCNERGERKRQSSYHITFTYFTQAQMIGTLAFEFQRRGKKKKDEEEKKAGLEHTRESLILIRALILILIFVYYANPVCSSPSSSVVVVVSSFFFFFFFFTCVFLFPQRRCVLPRQAFCAL